MAGTRRKPGRMGPHIAGLQARWLELGYTPGSVRGMLKVAGQLGRWMAVVDIEVSGLDATTVDAFVRDCRDGDARRVPGVRSLTPLLDYLRSQDLLVEETPPQTPVDELLADYHAWLVVDRGLAGPTVLRYENLARRFLRERAAEDGIGFIEELAGADVIAFLMRESARVSVGAAKGRVAELRSLLRFLYLKGMTATALASAVPPVAGWHDTGIPSGPVATDVQLLLDGCDRNVAGGIRDFAGCVPYLV